MSNLLASDDQNTAFVGAHNPDDRLHAVFYKKTLKNEFLSKTEGRPIFFEADFIKIHIPGSQLFDIDTFVNDTHKQRFPRQWAHYMNTQKADSEAVIGTPLVEWPIVSRSMAEELRHIGFRSVESIAQASDSQLQAIGMRVGMQPHAFREKAQRWLEQAKQGAAADKTAEEREQLRKENADMQKAIEEMRAQMAEMAQNQKAKPGRKPKSEE